MMTDLGSAPSLGRADWKRRTNNRKRLARPLTALRHLLAGATLLAPRPATSFAQRPEALWYMTGSEGSIQSFLSHADQISIVSPQVFAMDRNGMLHGSVDARVVAKAHDQHVKLVPLVMNPGFDQPSIHHVLRTPAARMKAIVNIAALCKREHFD